jgi:hypothetical protein
MSRPGFPAARARIGNAPHRSPVSRRTHSRRFDPDIPTSARIDRRDQIGQLQRPERAFPSARVAGARHDEALHNKGFCRRSEVHGMHAIDAGQRLAGMQAATHIPLSSEIRDIGGHRSAPGVHVRRHAQRRQCAAHPARADSPRVADHDCDPPASEGSHNPHYASPCCPDQHHRWTAPSSLTACSIPVGMLNGAPSTGRRRSRNRYAARTP